MKTLTIFSLLILCSVNAIAQEGVERITRNTDLIGSKQTNQLKSTTNSIDSTFIYTVDTLSLPIFDDFSKNCVQQYQVGFSDPGVTSELFYRVLDEFDNPMAMDIVFTTQPTFKKTFNTVNNEITTETFTPIIVKVGDLSKYPVVYTTKEVYPPYYIFDTIGIANPIDTIYIIGPDITQETARQFKAHIQDPTKFWQDDNAYQNYRFGKNPWSIGVMTFDGLNSQGFPYKIGTTLRGRADYLTSKPIDLSTASASDSIYLTFLYQRQGFGEAPENNDSLIVEFFNKNDGEWYWQWATTGGEADETFKLAHLKVANPAFFNDHFQFRFINYGDLSGSLDHFHIDYVHLRDFSGYQDTLIEDFAVVYPTISLLKDYTSVPWDHFKNNPTGKMNTDLPVTVRNSFLNGGNNISSAQGGKINILYQGNLEGTINLNGQALVNYNPTTQPIPDYAPRTTYESIHDISSAYNFDNSKTGTHQLFDIQTIATVPVGGNYLPNDTAYSQQYFGYFYSYDDGTAELAYGPQGAQSRLAIQYTPYQADSVIGALIHFVPTVNDVTGKLFQLTIWDDNNGEPGQVLYQDNASTLRQPDYGWGRNHFVQYFTKDSVRVPVSGTFYIGWKQIDALRLGVGLDVNTDHSDKTFFSLDNEATWQGSQIPGSVMIRPIFSTSMNAELGIEQLEAPTNELTLYPNPTSGELHITSETGEIGIVTIYSMMGNVVMTTTENIIDLSEQPNGVYFVRSTANMAKTYKVVKSK